VAFNRTLRAASAPPSPPQQSSACNHKERKPFESWVTWPMSEGIQGQKRKKEENSTNISTPAHEQAEEEKSNPLGTYEGPRARKAALLVKVYGNSNECFKNREPNSDTAFVNFIRNLVSRIRKFKCICHFLHDLLIQSSCLLFLRHYRSIPSKPKKRIKVVQLRS
jgi:hypothetical protein